MESADFSSVESSKNKKISPCDSAPLSSPLKHKKHSPSQQPNLDPWSSKTPEKAAIATRRLRNRGSALSLKEVKEAAQKLRQNRSDPNESRSDPLMSAALEQIPLWPESSHAKLKKSDGSIKLPERYEILEKFFCSLDSSIRLLRIKGSATTFTNISPKIECLTDRRFTHSHLAQLKFILPEAIELKKILVYDERTCCMKPDLYVSLNIQAIQNTGKMQSEIGNLELRKVFHSRLLDFLKAHPEGDEIPEGDLPEPFNRSRIDIHSNLLTTSDSSVIGYSPIIVSSDHLPASASHFAQSFARRFSLQGSGIGTRHEKLQENNAAGHAFVPPVSRPKKTAESRSHSSASSTPMRLSSKARSDLVLSPNTSYSTGMPTSPPPATPVKECLSKEHATSLQAPHSTTTPAKLMSNTPVLQPPKRCYLSPDDDSIQPTNKLTRRPSRSRSLKFDTPVKNAKVEVNIQESAFSGVGSDILDILPENLIQSIREKERKALLDQDPAISRAKLRQQMLASLPKLFDTIYFLFQSIRRSVITKEELMHKLVSGQLSIVDRREVEEQLRLLQELVPEWIYEKVSSSGDILLCVNKIPSAELVRNRLAEAK